MSINQQFVSDGLVFYCDTSNVKSYAGKPATNILTGITSWNGTVDSANYKIFDAVEKVYIPKLKKNYDCRYVQIYNNDSANNCCPSLLQYGWPATTTASGNTLYTYSIIYKCTSGYTHPNYMYHYEYGPSGYITEYGVFDTSKRTDLGSGWYHAWNTFTTNAATNTMYTGSWYYQYGVYDRYYVAAANLIVGNYIIPPEQMLASAQTRSNTEGLIDLTGNTTIDLSSATFNSSALITYDGSSCITVNDTAILRLAGDKSFLMWINMSADSSGCGFGGKSSGTLAGMSLGYGWNGNGFMSLAWNSSNAPYLAKDASRDVGKWVLLAAVQSGSTRYIYAIDASGTRSSSSSGGTHSWDNNLPLKIGRINDYAAMPSGTLIGPVSVYNRALTSAEVLKNFNSLRSRYNV